jgi:hypothetical protein
MCRLATTFGSGGKSTFVEEDSKSMVRTKPRVKTLRWQFQIVYLSLAIAMGFGLRVAKLDSLPLTLSLDEAVNGIDALRLFRAGWITPFLQNNFGRETLFFYLQSLALQLYGISFFSLRFVSVLVGTLTIPLLYAVGWRFRPNNPLLSKTLSTNMPGMLAATGLAVSYWHIFFSRIGLRAILLPPLLLVSVWCFWQGWYAVPNSSFSKRTHRRRWLIAAGLFLGFTFYTYLAARLLPILFIAFVTLELAIDRSSLKRKIVDFLILGLASAMVAIPLAYYFYQNPHAFVGRTQAISIFARQAPLHTLTSNLVALLQVHLLGGTWLGQWPALNVLSALGFLSGLLVCLYHVKKAPCRFLILWWVVGVSPIVLSQQNWGGTSTILRGIVAWPALFLISAIGLTTWVSLIFKWTANVRSTTPKSENASMPSEWVIASLILLLFVGGFASIYNYFSVWATTHSKRSNDGPVHMARYLNSQTHQLSLIPLSLFQENATSFLLQDRYPNLSNIDVKSLRALLERQQQASPDQVSAIFVLPDELPVHTSYVLLVPSSKGSGTAFLLPPFASPQIEALLNYANSSAPVLTIRNSKQEPTAHVYPLFANSPFLQDEPIPLQSIKANFNDDVWLTGYHVEPPVAKPGEPVTLYLNWQVQRPVDGDYYLFLHLFDVLQAQRWGQSNSPLNNIIRIPRRGSASFTFLDTYHFELPPDSPTGIYLIELGLYHNFSLERLPVIIGEAAQFPDNKVILGKFHVQLQPPHPPQYPIDAQFGDIAVLVGGDFPERTLHPGQTLNYTLHWQALYSTDQDYTVFNHLLDTEGNLRAQRDSMPQGNRYPMSMWDPGEIVIDPYAIPLPPELEPGQYTLRIGLYETGTGQRLSIRNKVQEFVELPGFITLTQ